MGSPWRRASSVRGSDRARRRSATRRRREARELVERKLRAKYVDVGPSQLLAPAAQAAGTGSTLLLDELFRAADPRFLDELLACTSDKKLATFAEPWIADPRPEMRRALLDYVDDGCDRWGHKGLVKHLFKAAEKRADDELMAHFMVAFDRLVRRYPVKRLTWSRGATHEETVLVSDPLAPDRLQAKQSSPRFSRRTRRYLARRAFRWFRVIGRADRKRYARAMRIALPLYRDAHLDTPVRLLDAWALLHVLYAWSPVLDRNPRGIRVVEGSPLADLAPAPYFKDAWLDETNELLAMLAQAKSRTVRRWTVAWLETHHAATLDGVALDALRPLLASDDEDVARFGAKLLPRARCGDARRRRLARSPPDRKRRRRARGRRVLREERRAEAPQRTPASRTRGVLERRPEHVRDLLDSRFADVRALVRTWFENALEERKAADVPLWFALLESPYDDVRALVVKHAEEWQAQAGASEIEHLAATVLLAVHRGSGAKQSMLRRLADRAAERPDEADRLLPVLSIALRSVRPAERAGALAALTRAAVVHDALRAAVARYVPELSISEQVAR